MFGRGLGLQSGVAHTQGLGLHSILSLRREFGLQSGDIPT